MSNSHAKQSSGRTHQPFATPVANSPYALSITMATVTPEGYTTSGNATEHRGAPSVLEQPENPGIPVHPTSSVSAILEAEKKSEDEKSSKTLRYLSPSVTGSSEYEDTNHFQRVTTANSTTPRHYDVVTERQKGGEEEERPQISRSASSVDELLPTAGNAGHNQASLAADAHDRGDSRRAQPPCATLIAPLNFIESTSSSTCARDEEMAQPPLLPSKSIETKAPLPSPNGSSAVTMQREYNKEGDGENADPKRDSNENSTYNSASLRRDSSTFAVGSIASPMVSSLHHRAKMMLLMPSESTSLQGSLIRRQYSHSHSGNGSAHGAESRVSTSLVAAQASSPPGMTPLLNTPYRMLSSIVSSPLDVNQSILDVAPRSPNTFGDALTRRHQRHGGKVFHVWQILGSDGHPAFDTSLLVISAVDYVCIHWFDQTAEIYETDSTYRNVVPGGRHSTYNEPKSFCTASNQASPISELERQRRHQQREIGNSVESGADAGHLPVISAAHSLSGNHRRSEAIMLSEGDAPLLMRSTSVMTAMGGSCEAFMVSFPAPGEYYFVCSRNKQHMQLRIHVQSSRSFWAAHVFFFILAILGVVGLIVMVVLVLAYWLQKHTNAFSFGADTVAGQYTAFLDFHSLISLTLFPWLATGVLVILLTIIAGVGWAVYKCTITRKAGSFSRGVKHILRRVVDGGSILLAFAIVVLLFTCYGLQLNVSNSMNRFTQTLATGIVTNVETYSTALTQVNWVINESQTLFPDIELPVSQIHSVVGTIAEMLNTTVKWTFFIEDISQAAFQVLPISLFLTMQLGLFASSMLIGTLVVQNRSRISTATWLIAVSIGIYACLCGLLLTEQKLLKKIDGSLTVLQERPQDFPQYLGLPDDNTLTQVFSKCSLQTEDIRFISNYIEAVLRDVNSSLSASEQAQFSELFSFVASVLPYALESVVNSTDYIQANIQVFMDILTSGSNNVDSVLNADLINFLKVILSIGVAAYGLVNCQVLKDVLADAIPYLKNDTQYYNEVLLVFLLLSFAVSVVLLIFSASAAYAAQHPRKKWFNPRSGRWFLLRYSYKIHMQTFLQATPASKRRKSLLDILLRQAKPIMYRLLNVKLICYSASVLMLFDAIFLVLLDGISVQRTRWNLLVALSYLGCSQLFFLLFASMFRTFTIRLVFRSCALLCAMGCLGLSLAQIIQGFILFGQCINYPRYEDAVSGRDPSMTCSAAYMCQCLMRAIYGTVCFLNSITLIVTMAVLVKNEKRWAASFMKRPYIGFLLPLRNILPPLRRLFQSKLVVERFYLGFLTTVVVIFLILFAVLDIADLSVLSYKTTDDSSTMPGFVNVINPWVPCNGNMEFCALRTNQIIWPCAHNAHSSWEDDFLLPNHYYNITRQLTAGIRYFMIDLWYDSVDTSDNSSIRDVYVCHTICLAGRKPLREIANEFKTFLDTYPGQVVMISIEQYVKSSDIGRIMEEVGLTKYIWNNTQVPPNYNPDFEWPTLQELVESGQRLFVFNDYPATSAESVGAPEWLYYVFDFQFENSYTTLSTSDWRCEITRGWCSDLPTGSSSSSGSINALSDVSSYFSSSSSENKSISPELKDITNCDLFNANPIWQSGSDAYNAAMKQNPPNVRSKLSIINHMITHQAGLPIFASEANTASSISLAAWNCSKHWNAVVNIVAFDFWNLENPLETIDKMNRNLAAYGAKNNFESNWKEMYFGPNGDIYES